ncbi:MAG: ATP-binding protein [Anaerolineae bacterium]
MKTVVVLSGKGGTGKTSVTAALGVVAGGRAVTVDCDVDASNLHLLYEPRHSEEHEFWSGSKAIINAAACASCGICAEKCRFDAIVETSGGERGDAGFTVDRLSCEGCALCYHLCPSSAIEMEDTKAGDWYVSRNRFGHWFVHARLGIGSDNSGKLVAEVKGAAASLARREDIPFVIADGPPGIGCPAIASMSETDHVLIVTEATQTARHDMVRLVELARRFDKPASCVINKCDLSEDASRDIEQFCQTQGIDVIGRLPFSLAFHDALERGLTLMESDDQAIASSMVEIWEHLERTA